MGNIITKKEILELPAGPTMNALIGQHLFELRPISADQMKALNEMERIFPRHITVCRAALIGYLNLQDETASRVGGML